MAISTDRITAVDLAESYRACERVAKTQARNFYYSFLTLDPARRAAMCAVYAFMRRSDDVSDEGPVDNRRASMERWRETLRRALEGDYADDPILPAFHDTVLRYS